MSPWFFFHPGSSYTILGHFIFSCFVIFFFLDWFRYFLALSDIFVAHLTIYYTCMASFSREICYGLIKKYIFGTWMSQSIHRSDFQNGKIRSNSQNDCNYRISPRGRGAKNRKKLFFSKWHKITQKRLFGCFWPFVGFLGSLEQKKALLFVILATFGLSRQIRIKYEKKIFSRQPKLA